MDAIIAIASSLQNLDVRFTRKSVRPKNQIIVVDVDENRIGQKIVMRKHTLEDILFKTKTFTRFFFS